MKTIRCLRAEHEPTEFDLFKFVVEASDLRIPPGRVPEIIETDIGNQQPFVFDHMKGTMAIYFQTLGCIWLHVLND